MSKVLPGLQLLPPLSVARNRKRGMLHLQPPSDAAWKKKRRGERKNFMRHASANTRNSQESARSRSSVRKSYACNGFATNKQPSDRGNWTPTVPKSAGKRDCDNNRSSPGNASTSSS